MLFGIALSVVDPPISGCRCPVSGLFGRLQTGLLTHHVVGVPVWPVFIALAAVALLVFAVGNGARAALLLRGRLPMQRWSPQNRCGREDAR